MKAIVYEKYGGPEVLELKEIAKPTPKKDQVLIKIHAVTVTMGDCELRSPKIPYLLWFIVRLAFGLFKPRKKILGGYFAGEVEAIGEKVKKIKKGDQLFGVSGADFGAYAEYVSLSESNALTTLPSNMTYEEAAPVALGLDSLHFLRKAKIKAGEKVLINGAGGGIGTYAVQIAKYLGAEVTAVDSGDKLDILRSLGADFVIDYQKEDFVKSGKTYDVVFDVVGVIAHANSLKLLQPNGRYLSAIPQFPRIFKSWITDLTSNKKVMTGLTSPTQEDLNYLKDLIETGKLKTALESSIFPFEKMADAHRYIESGRKIGNLVINIIQKP